MVEGTNLKFCTWIEGKGPDTKQKNAKLVKTGYGLDHVEHLCPVIF